MNHCKPSRTRTRLRAGLAAALLLLGSTANAFEPRYLLGSGDGYGIQSMQGGYDSSGIPLDEHLTLTPVSATLMDRIALTLPEGKDVRKTGSHSLIADSDASTLHLVKDADVWVTFLHEGAGYKNAFGYYAYPENDPPQSRDEVDYVVVFPNTSFSWHGGNARGLQTGHQVYLGRFTKGTKIGFFTVANGFDSSKGVIERYPGWVWHSLQDLNMEADPSYRAHIVILKDETDDQLVLGVEDINRESSGCDHDFDDVLVSIQANPYEAIATEKIAELIDPDDTDGDLVMNSDDDYPHDPERALRVRYPNDKGRAQIAFEDMWPFEGDYDMDDLVLAYSLTEVRDAAGNIRDLEGSFQIKARGSGYSHGFGLSFPNLPPEILESGSLWVDDQPEIDLVSESGQPILTLILTEDTRALADRNPGTRHCYARKFNVDPYCDEAEGPTIHFRASFTHALTRDELGAAPYNPFIYIKGDRLREIHLPDHPPTGKHKSWLFGWRDEGSDPKRGRYFKTKQGLPWAINLPVEWQQPLEKNPIHHCYPGFVGWVNSRGTGGANWYEKPKEGCVFPYNPTR